MDGLALILRGVDPASAGRDADASGGRNEHNRNADADFPSPAGPAHARKHLFISSKRRTALCAHCRDKPAIQALERTFSHSGFALLRNIEFAHRKGNASRLIDLDRITILPTHEADYRCLLPRARTWRRSMPRSTPPNYPVFRKA